ncbi:helix-turn-helix transcriptional regulator [Paludibacterium yongneupense]|uniref:helix-turn-helix transcriptional regulator n=1 Tax=Paludibacterium yongneupense TaxID=400061 RepID=UPI000490E9C1|nr:AraC family transcriptional regulator [Paludibacterium yongneupense]
MQDHTRYQPVTEIPGLVLGEAVFADFDFGRHFHLDLHIGLVSTGCQRQRFNGKTFYLTPARISVMPAGEIHDGSRAGDAAYALRTFRLSPDLLRGLAEELIETGREPWPAGAMLDNPRLAWNLLRLHHALGQKRMSTSLEVQSAWPTLLGHLFALSHGLAPRAGTGRLPLPQWRQLHDYCIANIGEKITLDHLAAVCGLGRFPFLRQFKHTVGMTPHAWLLRLRLEQACILLTQHRRTVAQIAHSVGFYDQSHFNRAFRLAFGVPPSRYAAT